MFLYKECFPSKNKIRMSVNSSTKSLVIASFLVLTIILFPEISFAQSPFDAIDEKGQEATNWATTTLWTTLSTLAILVLAAGLFMGKINWQTALIVFFAIILGFAAPEIVSALQN